MTCQNIHRQNFWLAVNTIRGREARIMQREKTLEYQLHGSITKGEINIIEHWVDYSVNDGEHVIMGAQMPRKYVAEMVMDRISASRNYLGDAYNDSQPLEYFLKSKEKLWFIHPQTNKELEALLRILNDHGEEKLLHYIKYRYLKGETRKIRY